MSELSAPALPAWVHKRDGRLVPFDPDRICHALFAATEALGRPDAFLARELTDSVLHFLAGESAGTVPTTAQVAELAAKVVRELGQPTLARAYEDGAWHKARRRPPAEPPGVPFRFDPEAPPAAVASACLREYSLHAVFSRDLAAAQADGLLTLAGLDAPLGLAGCVAAPALRPGEALAEAAVLAGSFVALDGPEYALSRRPGGGDPAAYTQELQRGLLASGLRALVNLGSAIPPAWAEEGPGGPLFVGSRSSVEVGHQEVAAEALLDCLLAEEGLRRRVTVLWHLGERDFGQGGHGPRLLQAARAAAGAAAVRFVFDRPRRPVALGPGLDRRHEAVLLAVGLHLPRLADVAGPGAAPELFLKKLASLARLALSAGAQKRAFLRRQSRAADGTVAAVGRGFLPDRARLVVVPVGLDAAVRRVTGRGLGDDRPALDFGREVVRRLAAVLEQEGAAGIDACLDGTAGSMAEWEREPPAAAPAADQAAGLTTWDPGASPRSQLRAAGALHALAGRGTAVVVLPEAGAGAEEVADLVQFAWRQTDAAGLRLVRVGRQEQQHLPGLL